MPVLSQDQLSQLTALRHALHRRPEISGEEAETAEVIADELTNLGADRIWRGLGGHGVAAEFTGASDGPTVLLRCELDGLPIREISDLPIGPRSRGRGICAAMTGIWCRCWGSRCIWHAVLPVAG